MNEREEERDENLFRIPGMLVNVKEAEEQYQDETVSVRLEDQNGGINIIPMPNIRSRQSKIKNSLSILNSLNGASEPKISARYLSRSNSEIKNDVNTNQFSV